MSPTFQALAKNGLGRLTPQGVRHILQSYFARKHGISFLGMEAHGWQSQTSAGMVHDAEMLQRSAMHIAEALLEERSGGRGLSLDDVAVVAVLLENLILDESTDLLQDAYTVREHELDEPLSMRSAQEVLTAFLLMFKFSENASSVSPRALRRVMNDSEHSQKSVSSLWVSAGDAANNLLYARRHTSHPFDVRLSFDALEDLVGGLVDDFGQVEHAHCRKMKETLMHLDAEGSGLVPLGRFFDTPKGSGFIFDEEVAQLRATGILEEHAGLPPQVRVANYLISPSNCYAKRPYFSVCCINECEALMREVEGYVRGPVAFPDNLAAFVANLSSSTVDAPRVLRADLVEKLAAIGKASQGGQVPLHGRMFAQWMHFAFPHECPFPHIAEDVQVLSRSFAAKSGTVADADKELYLRIANASVKASQRKWSEEEVLLVDMPRARPVRSLGRYVVQGALLLATVAVLFETATRAQSSLGSAPPKPRREATVV